MPSTTKHGTATFTDDGSFQFQPDASNPNPNPEPEPGEGWDYSALLTDETEYATPRLPLPGYLESITDPVFGTKITRISGDPGSKIDGLSGEVWGEVVAHHYPLDQAWNCDQTLLYLDTNREGSGTGGMFLDGETYEPRYPGSPPYGGTCDVRWDHANPLIMRLIGGGDNANEYGIWAVTSGHFTKVHTFDGYHGLTYGAYEGGWSDDGDTCIVSGTRNSDGKKVAFTYQTSTDSKSTDIDGGKWGSGWDATHLSPDGDYAVLIYGDDSVAFVRVLDGKRAGELPANFISHHDVIKCGGVQYCVGRDNDDGGLIRVRIPDNGATDYLVPRGFPTHTSARNAKVRRYAVCNYDDNRPNWQPHEDEIVMADVENPGKFFRLCHTHYSAPVELDYLAECQPCLSPDAGRVIFKSIWDNHEATPRPVYTFICDFRRARS